MKLFVSKEKVFLDGDFLELRSRNQKKKKSHDLDRVRILTHKVERRGKRWMKKKRLRVKKSRIE